uniref:Uncharacterized protein n=1 Tax=Romanomermis culicivorax TaxID=13658 RepID=A0A915K5Z9_ROMCU
MELVKGGYEHLGQLIDFSCLQQIVWLVQNWILRRAYILAKLLAPSKEITMVSSTLMKEKNVVQSLGLAVKVSMMNMVPL